MESSKELTFEVMITFPKLLQRRIEEYNSRYKTDFRLIEVTDDEVPFCKITVSNYKISDIFDLGYGLAALQYRLREKGEIDW
jgi:hypothetical protein